MTNARSATLLLLAAMCTLTFATRAQERSPRALGPAGAWDVRWDRGFTKVQPAIFTGRLTLTHASDGWVGSIRFEQRKLPCKLHSMKLEQGRFVAKFRSDDGWLAELHAWIQGDTRLVGELRAMGGRHDVSWTSIAGRRAADSALVPFASDPSMARASVEKSGLNAGAVATLIANAERENSTALVVIKDGAVVVERYRQPANEVGSLRAMSASKSIVTLAIGRLIAGGKLSLDTRLESVLPDCPANKRGLTVRHLLNHTSGMDPTRATARNATIQKHTLSAELQSPPGALFRYNNNAVDLLAVLVKQAAGVQLDAYLEEQFFAKMGIANASWLKDRESTPLAAGELKIRPIDLAKIGQLMAAKGTWQEQRLLPAEWIDQVVAQGQPFVANSGLLWWREGRFLPVLTEPVLQRWRDATVSPRVIANARTITGKQYQTLDAYLLALRKAVGAAEVQRLQQSVLHGAKLRLYASAEATPSHGYSARGWLGQFLVVYPEHNLIAVRMRRAEGADYRRKGRPEDDYREFPTDVWNLLRSGG